MTENQVQSHCVSVFERNGKRRKRNIKLYGNRTLESGSIQHNVSNQAMYTYFLKRSLRVTLNSRTLRERCIYIKSKIILCFFSFKIWMQISNVRIMISEYGKLSASTIFILCYSTVWNGMEWAVQPLFAITNRMTI